MALEPLTWNTQMMMNISFKHLSICILYFSWSSYALEKSELRILVSNCRNPEYSMYEREIQIFRDGKELKTVNTGHENEIILKDLGCTTVDQYVLTYRGESISFTDGSCTWMGFSYLTRQLFKDN